MAAFDLSEALLNAMATAGGARITHIGLGNVAGTEISGGSPAYARVAVTWTTASAGLIRPNADLTFNVPASTTVAGWLGFGAATGGTTDGGHAVTNETFAAQGQYKLLAASTYLDQN